MLGLLLGLHSMTLLHKVRLPLRSAASIRSRIHSQPSAAALHDTQEVCPPKGSVPHRLRPCLSTRPYVVPCACRSMRQDCCLGLLPSMLPGAQTVEHVPNAHSPHPCPVLNFCGPAL